MFRPTWSPSQNLPLLLHLTTDYDDPGPRSKNNFFFSPRTGQTWSNWQLTACCLQLPALSLNAKLTNVISAAVKRRANTNTNTIWWEGETPRRKKWKSSSFYSFLLFYTFCFAACFVVSLFMQYFSKLFPLLLMPFLLLFCLPIWHLVVVCLFYQFPPKI